ncbi:MAG: 50S ribosome-binding GTPase [Planctomycetales bacterium]|nr:50S ribosome-binding GTPase [Planctomycetales bacterium]
MNRAKAAVLVGLFSLPLAAFLAAGTWMLWENGWLLWLWWLYPACWGLGYVLIRWWQPRATEVATGTVKLPMYWTERDRQALAIIEAEQRRVKEIAADRLIEPRFYLEAANQLALKIARHYHPKTSDPYSSLTLPEVLAAAHLALEELERWVERYVPGSHLLTIRQWRTLSNAPTWMRVARDVSWLASMFWSPFNAGRYLLSRVTMDSASQQLQTNLLAWFYAMYLRHVGFYLIEMNSGRLRLGADRYRTATREFHSDGRERVDRGEAMAEPSGEDGANGSAARQVTIAVVGQVKAGKSSVINALFGEQRAAVDVVPLTKEIEQYRLKLPGRDDELVLLDTAGYADAGATREQLDQSRQAFQRADLVLLVLRANSPARDADVRFLAAMRDWFDDHLDQKPPPVLGVLTHVDALRPVMEWTPPYDWQQGESPKAASIRDAVRFNVEQFGPLLTAVVPVCADAARQRSTGIDEDLLPAITALLGEARGCAVLRTLHRDWEARRVKQTFAQLRASGWQIIQACLWGPNHS